MKKRLLQILLPLVIVLLIGGIWLIKKNQTVEGVEVTGDFALEADETLDVAQLTQTHGLPVMIDFGADYCGPCRQMEPTLISMHEEMLEKAIIKKVDTQKYSSVASEYPVQVIPTQIFYTADGKPYEPSEDVSVSFKQYHYKEDGALAFTVHEGILTADQMREIFKDMGVE